MLKKLLKAVTTTTLLIGCYVGYVHVFGLVVEHLRAVHDAEGALFPTHDSDSKLQAIAIARAGFGRDHWSADENLPYRYYNSQRGFWMYTKKAERIVEEDGIKYDGKRLRMEPFALIWRSRDGNNTKTILGDVAVFDLNEPLSLNINPNGEALKIKHAHIERNVLIRDDHGTPGDPKDDMRIGPLTAVEYDEPTQKIESPSPTVIQDSEMRTTCTGIEIQLRASDAASRPGQSSGGFAGAEWAILKKNVHVEMRDVGKTGFLPGSTQTRKAASGEVQVQAQLADTQNQGKAPATRPSEPTPLDVKCDGMMRIDMPKPVLPVKVGPPEPPPPTLVRFERNVVVLRGQLDDQPDQLTCDTLRLTMIPAEKPARDQAAPAPQGLNQNAQGSAQNARQTQPRATPEVLAEANPPTLSRSANSESSQASSQPGSQPDAPSSESKGLFGDLTLQRAFATGHAVWLSLPTQGVKLRCNELIHKRQAPFKADETYFRGDTTRPLELWKLDFAPKEDDDDPGKVTGVTYIKTVAATLFDNGNGLDTANVVADGPGRLETRPDRNQPVERIAIWQDKLTLQNQLAPDHTVQTKIIDLTGSRPCFIDKLQEARLDSAFWIRVWLKPRPTLETGRSTAQADSPAAPHPSAVVTGASVAARNPAKTNPGAGEHHQTDASPAGSTLQLERLLAVRDAHLVAPGKTMTARERLDAEFVYPDPSTTKPKPKTSQTGNQSASDSSGPDANQSDQQAHGSEQDTPGDAERTQAPAPPMIGTADRIWAKVAMLPETEPDPGSRKETGENAAPGGGARSASTTPGALGQNSEVRNVWMFGSVSLHQDPSEGNTTGQDASGQALYLDNRGPGKALTYIYSRDPTEDPPRPGPVPLAQVSSEDKLLKGEIIRVDQATDRVWVHGPGTSTQLTDRGLLSDKSPDAGEDAAKDEAQPADAGVPEHDTHASKPQVHETARLAQNNTKGRTTATPDQSPSTKPKPATRAGRPLTQKVPLTITWTKNMEFMGRSVDPDGQPAAKAIFYGIVNAEIEDGVLHCEDHMITYTDRVIPLAELGNLAKPAPKPKSQEAPQDETEPKPELALIECFKNAIAINRKVDPDRPIELQREIVQGAYLNYDRRSGEFYVPGKGIVYLYDRDNKTSDELSASRNAASGDKKNGTSNTKGTTSRRTVTPTSERVLVRSPRTAGAPATRTLGGTAATPRTAAQPAHPAADEPPPLVLTQIKFANGMRGRFGTGTGTDTTQTRWAEFFGDIQAARAKVDDVHTSLNEDKLPSDGFFLTGQILRVITEPPPPGAPPSTPARNYLKAWENAYVRNSDSTVHADIITYDSSKDLIYAHDEQGQGVVFAQQHAVGQPAAQGRARAVQLNPKTGAINLTDSDHIQLIDRKTGTRPTRVAPPDPNAKPPKRPKPPVRVPNNSLERRGFTGQ